MKKYLSVLAILISLLVFIGCQQPTGESGDTYVTNNINIIWKGSFDSAPLNPSVGWAYYDTSKKMSFVWDGSSWQMIAQDGRSIIWKGERSRAPENPEENWAYYNTLDGNSYIYNGFKWDYLAKSGRDGASGIMLWLGSYSEPPISPSVGYCYYNTNDCCSYIWNGTSWDILAKDGTNGIDGKSIIWKGVLSSAPLNPEENWAYYNTTSQISYIWDGASWNILAQSVGGDTTVQVAINWRGSFTSAPSNPKVGDAYYNSTLKASYIYDGIVWQQISKDGQDGTYTYSGTGYLITWKGSLSSSPANPKAGWAYYNITKKISYVYDGSSWQIMAKDGDTSSSNDDTGRTVYLGESIEVIDGISYVVKKYADVYGGTDYYYTIYKNYYLNNKLKRTWMAYHSAGSVELDYKYYEYVEHTCGISNSIIMITDFYDNGKIKYYHQDISGTGYTERKYDETGVLLEYNIIYNTVKQYTSYYASGNEKTYKYYLPKANDFYLYQEKEYYDDASKTEKKYIIYYENGAKNREIYKNNVGKVTLEINYDENEVITRKDEYTYYASANIKTYNYYTNGYLYNSYEYFDLGSKPTKVYKRYNNDGSLYEEDYYYEPNKKELEVDYNSDGTIDDYEYYYESGYIKYYYTDSGYFYTYEDGKTKSYSTSSSYYSSKTAYTNAQALTKLDTLRPQD